MDARTRHGDYRSIGGAAVGNVLLTEFILTVILRPFRL